ncbi:energy transducer TonB [candidate division KSB1 bacterium]|nr:energy transducer TonB [candidate division KSB1 bacterium]
MKCKSGLSINIKLNSRVRLLVFFLLVTTGIIAGCGTSSVYKAPKILFEGNLEYPLDAQLNKIEGRVLVAIFVSKKGIPQEVNILQSSGSEELDSAAVEFSKGVSYEPAIYKGVPVGSWTRLELRYTLQKVHFDESDWVYEIRQLQSQISAEPDSSKRRIFLQRLFMKYLGVEDYVDKTDDLNINKSIKTVISEDIARQWTDLWNVIPLPFVLLDDMLFRYPDCSFKMKIKEDMIAQLVDAEYKIRMKSLKSSRYNSKLIFYLDILRKKMEELQKP